MAFASAYNYGVANDLFSGALSQMQNLGAAQTKAIAGVPGEYAEIAGQYDARTQQLQGMLTGYGDVQRAELAKTYEQQKASKQQELASRGMTNASAYDAAMRGLETDYQSNLRSLNDTLNREAMGYMTQWTGEALGAKGKVPESKLQTAQQSFAMGKEAPLMQERLGQYKSAQIRDSGVLGGGLSSGGGGTSVSSVTHPDRGGGSSGGGSGGGGGGGGGTGTFLNPAGGYYDMFAGAAAQNSLQQMWGDPRSSNKNFQPRNQESSQGQIQENPYASDEYNKLSAQEKWIIDLNKARIAKGQSPQIGFDMAKYGKYM